MIPRYSRPTIEKIWSLENKFNLWLEIECLVVEKLSINGTIPKQAAIEIKTKAKFKAPVNTAAFGAFEPISRKIENKKTIKKLISILFSLKNFINIVEIMKVKVTAST